MKPRAPLACAAALAALFTVALGQQLCETTQFGNESLVRVSQPVRRVEPGMFTLEINEPDVCLDSEAVGLKVTACDAGQPPRVLLLDTARGMVVRAGALAGAAQVYTTVYCAEPSDAAPDSEEAPATDISTPTTTISPTPLLSFSTPDSLQLSELEPPSTLTSSTNEYLPPVRLESRFSSVDQSNGPPTSTSLSSIMKDLWKDRAASSLGQLKSQSFPGGASSRLQENEQSLLDKAKHQPSIFDSYSTLINSLSKSSSPSLAKRLIDLRPRKPHERLENRAPAWKRRPTRRPSSPWLKLRSMPDDETRKAMSRSRHNELNAFTDYNDPWTPYEDDPLSLHWTEELEAGMDSNPWYTEGDLQSPYTNNFPWRIKPPKTHNLNQGSHASSHHKRPSPSSIKHDSKKQSRFVPPIHEEDPALLMEWKKHRPRSKRPPLPKLLLLLQDQEHQAPVHRKCSAHSVEDTEPWWSNQPYKHIEDEAIPWQPDYPADYTADDGDARSYTLENYIDDRLQPPHVAPAKKRAPTRPPRHHATPPARLVNAKLLPHASQKPPPSSKAPPFESYFYYSPTPLTERPLLTSTVRNSLPWIKSSNAKPLKPLKSPMKLKQPSSKKLLNKLNHHNPPDHNYRSDQRYPSKPLVPTETNYPPETHNPPNHHYPSEPYYPPETYNPSQLQSNLFSEAEKDFPSEPKLPSRPHSPSGPHLPSGPHYPPETHLQMNPFSEAESNFPSEPHYPPEPYYPSESGNVPPQPNYPSEPFFPPVLGNDPSEPENPSEPSYQSESGNVPSEPNYSSGPHFPPEPHYPSGPEFPPEPDYPLEFHYPPEHHYPSGSRFPPESDYPSDPHYPSGLQYPPEPHYPSEPDYPSEHHYPSGPHFQSEADYLSQYLQSSAPWKFLSELLLTHPSFRDSTHVIRIR